MIIDRYIHREIIKPTVTICSVLVFVFGCYMSARYLADAVSGQLPGSIVFILILLRITVALEVLLPMTLYLSVIIALGRLYKDSEMTALSACGVSGLRVLRPVFFLSVVIAVLVAGLSLYIRPWAYHQFFLMREKARSNFDLTRVKGGNFYAVDNGNRVIFADHVDLQQNRAKRVFIQTEDEDTLQIIFARHARQLDEKISGKKILVFTDGYLYEFSHSGQQSRIVQFDQSAMPLEPVENVKLKSRVKVISTAELARSNSLEEIAELQWRLSMPVSTILLALLAVPLSRSSPRRGKYAKVVTAVLFFALYYNLGAIAKKWVEKAVVNPVPGLWWVHILLAGLLLIILWQPAMLTRWRRRLKFT